MGESMKDYEAMLEESYSLMGDGVHDTDTLLAWRKAKELQESQENIKVTVSEIVKGGVVADFEGIRAFIPISKLSLERIDDLNPFFEKELEVRVFEADMDTDKLILSAKEILKERQEKADPGAAEEEGITEGITETRMLSREQKPVKRNRKADEVSP